MVKGLLTVTAVLESFTGVALATSSAVPLLLLGARLDTGPGVVVGRVAGAALLSLGVACWLSRHDTQSAAARGLVAAVLLYNVSATAVLAFAGLGMGFQGVALWPAVAIHAALAMWSAACVRRMSM